MLPSVVPPDTGLFNLSMAHKTRDSQCFSSKQKQGTKRLRRDVWHEQPTPELWGVTGPPAAQCWLPDPEERAIPTPGFYGLHVYTAVILLSISSVKNLNLAWILLSLSVMISYGTFKREGFIALGRMHEKKSKSFKVYVWIEGLLFEAANYSLVFIFSSCTSKLFVLFFPVSMQSIDM